MPLPLPLLLLLSLRYPIVWNSDQMLREAQNKGFSDPTKGLLSSKMFFLKNLTNQNIRNRIINCYDVSSLTKSIICSRAGVAEWFTAPCCVRPPMLVDTSASTWIKKAWLPCWPLYSQQVLHQRWIWGSPKWESMQRDPPWLWNPGQTSPEVQNRGISGPRKRTYVLQKF